MSSNAKTFMVEDARIIFRNFSGKEGMYNKEGEKSFAVILDPAVAQKMLADDWNVKFLKVQEEGDEPIPYISVDVRFDNYPPNVVLITDTARTNLNDTTIGTLDWADIRTVDLIARGYEWEVNGKRGVKAYLKSMFVTIEQDALEAKYAMPNEVHDG